MIPSELARDIRTEMADRGFVLVDRGMTQAEFEHLCKLLGSVLSVTEIGIDSVRDASQQSGRRRKDRPSVYRQDALGLHTDSPREHILGWYCARQDPQDGSSLLVDLVDLRTALTDDECTTLATVAVEYMVRLEDGSQEEVRQHPLLTMESGQSYVYYAPWNIREPLSELQRQVISRFETYLEHKRQNEMIRIRLQEGQVLFIDNRRMLHGRDAIPEDSQRKLIRTGLAPTTDSQAP